MAAGFTHYTLVNDRLARVRFDEQLGAFVAWDSYHGRWSIVNLEGSLDLTRVRSFIEKLRAGLAAGTLSQFADTSADRERLHEWQTRVLVDFEQFPVPQTDQMVGLFHRTLQQGIFGDRDRKMLWQIVFGPRATGRG
jgi:hypothetical protein